MTDSDGVRDSDVVSISDGVRNSFGWPKDEVQESLFTQAARFGHRLLMFLWRDSARLFLETGQMLVCASIYWQ